MSMDPATGMKHSDDLSTPYLVESWKVEYRYLVPFQVAELVHRY